MLHHISLDKVYCKTCEAHVIQDISSLPDVKHVAIDHGKSQLSIEIASKTAVQDILKAVQTILETVRPCPGPEKKEIITDNNVTILQQDLHCNACENVISLPVSVPRQFVWKWLHVPIGILGWVLCASLPLSDTVMMIGYLISFIVLGYPILIQFIRRTLQGKWLDETALMSIASIGAFYIHEYSEAMAVMLFYQIGEWLEERAVLKSKKTITSLMSLKPESVHRMNGDMMDQIPANQIHAGDTLLIKPGERIPLDGIIAKGSSEMDTSTITGESLPRLFAEGDSLYAGYINLTGTFLLTVTKDIHKSMISRILLLVESSLSHKTKTEKFITRFSAVYTPVIVLLAILVTFLGPWLFSWTFQEAFYRALVFLVVSCPCALIISVPLTLLNGLGAASRQGIVIKGTQTLENLTRVHSLFFDKTGTITEGKLTIQEWVSAPSVSIEKVQQWMAIGEYYSNHPIAKLIQKNLTIRPNPADFQRYREIPGKGILAVYQNHEIIIGQLGWFKENQVPIESISSPAPNILLSVDKQWLGGIFIEDAVKPDAKAALHSLKKQGIKQLILLSGDQKERVQVLADELDFDQSWAELLPEDKVERLVSYQKTLTKSQKTAFVGDGVNDAPVIARSDIGIAMGALGSDAAVEASDIVIMEDKLSKLPISIQIASKTKKIVWENIYMALLGKVIIILLGLFGVSSLWMAVFGDVGIALMAILNSIRVFYIKVRE